MTALSAKPLVWERETGPNTYPQRLRAVTPIAEYTVAGADGRDNWRWYRNGYSTGPGSLIERSMQDAMDAAEEHHRATLAACMEVPA